MVEFGSTSKHAINGGYFVFIKKSHSDGETWLHVDVAKEYVSVGTQFGIRDPRLEYRRFVDLLPEHFPGISNRQRAQVFRLIIIGAVNAWAREAEPEPVARVVPLSRTVSRLVASAAGRLTPELHARYASAWETDALWLDGRWARLRFALALRLWGVRRLRREAARAQEHDLPRRA